MDPTDAASSNSTDSSISELRLKHHQELENLTLATQPLKTLKYFNLAIGQYVRRFMARGGWFLLLIMLAGGIGVITATVGGPQQEHIRELIRYLQFGLWWLALGVASSIGLGSGLHTFVLYLGPHVALFTMKAVHCGRVDIKSAPYDTIQWRSGPSWLDRECSEYGTPLLLSQHGSRVPLSSILPQVQLEAILWGVGTALGELPPYFISRAASISGQKLEVMKELDSSSTEDSGMVASRLNRMKSWLLSHTQYLNFLTILVLASVPNPLFDLAGILCGQFGIRFWTFFLATLIGKAFIKTHIQTVFIISVCNNQLLDLVENKLIWLFSFFPGFGLFVPNLITKLHTMKDKYIHASPPVASNSEIFDRKWGNAIYWPVGKLNSVSVYTFLNPRNLEKKWDLSFSSIWNTVVWLMLMNFFIKIVTASAQSVLKEEHEKELTALSNNLHTSKQKSIASCSQASD